MLELDATTRSRLVDLRRLLRDGQARAQDQTHSGQLLAIVLLDAACEHAVGLALAHRNVSVGRNDSAEKSLTRLENLEEGRWKAQGRKGVIELRQQRNNAMHHGVGPRADDVGRWSRDSEMFVGSTVAHFFGIEIADVAVADSVRNGEVRRLLRTAESAIDAEDYAEAKYSAVDAFEAARRLWKGQRPSPGVPWYDRREANLPDGVREDLERLRDQAEVQPFATDFGEYLWLAEQHRRYHRRAPVPIEDALRALAFATEWILRWEAHTARQIDREAEWLAQLEPPTSGVPDALPSVRNVQVAPDLGAERFDPPMVRIAAQLQDLPDRERQQWCFFVGDSLSGTISGIGSRGAVCDPAGQLTFEIPLDSTHTELLVDRIIHATVEATSRWTEHCERQTAAAAEARDKLASCRDELQRWLAPGGKLRAVEFVPGREDAVRIWFSRDLDLGEAHWTLTLLENGYGDQPGGHRVDVGDDWAELPFSAHDDTGVILADVLRQLDESDARRTATRSQLERFASSLQASMSNQLSETETDPS